MPIHVVHIEDDRPLRDILRIALTATDSRINLHQFTTGGEALPYIEANRLAIDLFILDIRLPGSMNGLEIAKKIRELDCPGSIVLTSAYGTPNPELLESLRAEYFPKPWHIPEIIAKVFTYQMVAKPSPAIAAPTAPDKLPNDARVDGAIANADTAAADKPSTSIIEPSRKDSDTPVNNLPGASLSAPWGTVAQTTRLESDPNGTPRNLSTVNSSTLKSMAEQFTCPNCGNPYRRGELVCTRCGTLLVDGTDTRQFGEKTASDGAQSVDADAKPPGTAFTTPSKRIIFLVEGREVFLPVKPVVFVGRRISTTSTGSLPIDVDLSLFQAASKGVSRRHLQITVKDSLAYVTDLEATNGTRLNGRFIDSNNERLLRDGDELQLGHLRLRVRFE